MQSFTLYVPSKLLFGRGRIAELAAEIAPYGRKILVVYGGQSIRRSGLYDKVREVLAGFELFDLAGVEPNPKIGSVRRGVEICRKEGIEAILAVGGGSVIDAAKNIAAGARYAGDPWDLVRDNSLVKSALPLFTVLTLSATGSESDSGAVISNPETSEKMCVMAPCLNPVASVMDPEYTYSVPARQTAAGAADIMSHTFEQYLVAEGNVMTDAMCEGMLRTIIKYTPIAIAEPDNYEARAELMLAATFGCNGLLAMGRSPSPWPCHGIEHEISAFHDITHGVGLAIITPHWMRYSLTPQTAPRFAQYGVNVWGLEAKADPMETARAAIDRTAEFFASIGIPARLRDVGVDASHFEEMADHVAKIWWPLSIALRPIDREGVLEILRNSL